MVARLGEVMWVVDLNRQSLDRVVPDIAAGRLAAMFEAAGWHTVMVKYGPLLQQRPDLRARIDAMPNEEYQRLLRADAPELRERIEVDVDDLDDAELLATFRDLGGHDLAGLIDGYRQADEVRDRPIVVFAYTIKGWSLPTEGHPANHSALLNHAQYRELAAKLGEDAEDPFAPLEPGSPEARAVRARRAAGSGAARRRAVPAPKVPPDLGRKHTGNASHPAGLRALLRRPHPRGARGGRPRRHGVARTSARPPTSAAGSTRPGIWNPGDRIDWFADDTDTLVRWRESRPRPPHRARHRRGQPRRRCSASSARPGRATASRCCRSARSTTRSCARALEPWSFGIYAGGQSILVGTPSGVTLGPEGGAHQSVITPSIGIEQPGCVAYEPAFGQDFEWCFLHALSQLGKPGGTSAYFRLSHAPDRPVAAHRARARRRSRAATRCSGRTSARGRSIAVMGALVPRRCRRRADPRRRRGRSASPAPTCCSAPSRPAPASATATRDTLDAAVPPGRPDRQRCVDGHPHTLAFLGAPITCLGVQRFGQAGDIARALRAPRDRRRVSGRRRARPAGLELVEHDPRRLALALDARLRRLDLVRRRPTRAARRRMSKRGDPLEVLDRREDHQQLAGLGALERARRLEPARVDDLLPVDRRPRRRRARRPRKK